MNGAISLTESRKRGRGVANPGQRRALTLFEHRHCVHGINHKGLNVHRLAMLSRFLAEVTYESESSGPSSKLLNWKLVLAALVHSLFLVPAHRTFPIPTLHPSCVS